MKQKLLQIVLIIISLLLIAILVLFTLLHTRYITPLSQWIVNHTLSEPITFEKVSYQYPLHFQFDTVYIDQNKPPIDTIGVWINHGIVENRRLALDSLLVDGLSINQEFTQPTFFKYIQLHQLALKNLSYTTDYFYAKEIDIQISEPNWLSESQVIPYGNIQLYVAHSTLYNQSLNELLIDGRFEKDKSRIRGLSFKWQHGTVSLRAEQLLGTWHIDTLTMNKFHISNEESKNWDLSPLIWLKENVSDIDRLDILNSSLEWQDLSISNLDFSANSLSLQDNNLWQQQGEISFNAQSIAWKQQQWLEPNIQLKLKPNQIDIKDFNATTREGYINLSMEIKPDEVNIRNLKISGMKYYIENDQDTDWYQWLIDHRPNELSIEKLILRNSQIIQLQHKPYWQITGANGSIKQAKIIKSGVLGLWDGNLTLSANSASYNEVLSNQGVIEMHSKDNRWSLDRLFLPFEKGYIEAHAALELNEQSAPWSLQISADGVPLKLLTMSPIPLSGIGEAEVNMNGLAGDNTIFRHTLSGDATLSIRQGVINLPQNNQTIMQPFALKNMQLISDRGRLIIKPTAINGRSLNGSISGNWDLANNDHQEFEIQLRTNCQHWLYSLDKRQFITDATYCQPE
jgi:hypothetical protein